MRILSFAIVFFVSMAQLSLAADFVPPQTVAISAGSFVMGSDRAEREAAYQLDEQAYGHSVTRTGRWYEAEFKRQDVLTPAFSITKNVITNGDYAVFVAEQGYPPPRVDEKTWKKSGLAHPFERTKNFSWKDTVPPEDRALHPVVLVTHDDAIAYADWLSKKTGKVWRLPQEKEWEKAVRGTDGRRFPWGDRYIAKNLNTNDQGPFDTTVVGLYANGVGPFGLLDGGGQVFEWTSTKASNDRFIVKGGSWDDKGCGVCRPAARHGRPKLLKHILIGFRLVCEEC